MTDESLHDWLDNRPEADVPSASELSVDGIIDERNALIKAATSEAEVERIVQTYRDRYGV